MKLLTFSAFRAAFFARNSVKSGAIAFQRAYSEGYDPEVERIHQQLPKNYKSFAGAANVDNPAFFYQWRWKKQIDPSVRLPDYFYRGEHVADYHFVGQRNLWIITSALVWGWLIWRMYYGGYNYILGEPEFTTGPDISKWTDEELGIPNDDTMPPRIYEYSYK